MIGVAGEDGAGAIKLFKQHDAHQLMRPRGGAEGKLNPGSLDEARCQPIGSTDDEADCYPVFRPPLAPS